MNIQNQGAFEQDMAEASNRAESKFANAVPGWLRRLGPLFVITVLIPTLVAILYYGVMASDIYVSESRYIVRTQGKQVPTGLASLLAGGGDGGAMGNSGSAVAEYVKSRDALAALNKDGKIEEIYSRPNIDIFERLNVVGSEESVEDLHKHFNRYVTVSEDSKSSITTLTVKAYNAEDARWINQRLLELGERLVNRLNMRSRDDLVRYAQRDVEEAKEHSRRAALALANYRNRSAIIDPEKQAEVSLQMTSKLQDELVAVKTQLTQTRAVAPLNPQIPVMETRIAALQKEIASEMSGITGGRSSLAAKSAEYTRLMVESEYTEKLLTNAMASLQNATNEARRQQAYIERIVEPNSPDKATEPRRFRGIVAVLALGLVAWGVLTMLFSAMREHSL